MIEEVDTSLERWLRAEVPLGKTTADISFDQPERDWSARRAVPLVNLFLFSLAPSKDRAVSGDQLIVDEDGTLHRQRPAPVMEASYLLSVWGGAPSLEHELLARTMNLLSVSRTIPDVHLTDTLRAARPRPSLSVWPEDGVSASSLWNGLDVPARPAVQLRVDTPVGRPATTAAAPRPELLELGTRRRHESAAFAVRRHVFRTRDDDAPLPSARRRTAITYASDDDATEQQP